MARFASIWFPFLLAEYTARKNPNLQGIPFVMVSPKHGRMMVESVNAMASEKGIRPGMALADCKAIFPDLETVNTESGRAEKLLTALAEWCIGYTPFVAVDFPDGLLLDATGCPHLWGGEAPYLENIRTKLGSYGYTVRIALADTVGAAWGMCRFGASSIVAPGGQKAALKPLPPSALRLESTVLERLRKLGLQQIGSFMDMPPSVLRRRFGSSLPLRMGQAFGTEPEWIEPVRPVDPYQQRLCIFDPIATAKGIEIALMQLLESLCERCSNEGVGMRRVVFKAFRVDGNIQQIDIGTGRPSRNVGHLSKLFEHKICQFEPGLGFEMFVLEGLKIEPITAEQAAIWDSSCVNDSKVAELLDRIAIRTGSNAIKRYLPAQHYWPERSIKEASPLWESPGSKWRTDCPRPIHLLPKPEAIEVSAVLPDYPPMLFIHKGKRYTVVKSDGPERIEQEWWLADGLYRDYYNVEDENGARYWVFRSGPYDQEQPKWFLHGIFA